MSGGSNKIVRLGAGAVVRPADYNRLLRRVAIGAFVTGSQAAPAGVTTTVQFAANPTVVPADNPDVWGTNAVTTVYNVPYDGLYHGSFTGGLNLSNNVQCIISMGGRSIVFAGFAGNAGAALSLWLPAGASISASINNTGAAATIVTGSLLVERSTSA